MVAKRRNLPDGKDEQEVTYRKYSAPIPPPDMLAGYEQILPGAADRIIRGFESQSKHRQRCESIFVWTQSIKTILGVFCGFVVAMTTIIGGIYAALQGHPVLGGSLSFVGLAILVGAFVSERIPKKEDSAEEGN